MKIAGYMLNKAKRILKGIIKGAYLAFGDSVDKLARFLTRKTPIKFKEWSKDSFTSRSGNILPWDKAEHVIRGFLVGLFIMTVLDGGRWYLNLGFYSLFVLGYETYNGYQPYDGKHIEGFSFKDLVADYTGYLLAFGVLCLF